MLPRIFIDTSLDIRQHVILDGAASCHLLQVLRAEVGQALILFNGQGGEFCGRLIAGHKRNAVVLVEEYKARANESPLKIHLGQGLAKGDKMDFIIQKAVELGVATITPLFTERCNIKLERERLTKKLRHWRGVMIDAVEQSGRCCLPLLLMPQNLSTWCHALHTTLCLALTPQATTKISSLQLLPQHKEITILVGPEGGLSQEEIDFVAKNNFVPVAMGPRVLRTETAALAAISVLQAKTGDL